MGHHGPPQPTQRLKVAGEHAASLVAWGGDGWLAHQKEFGRRGYAGAEQRREDLGEERADRRDPSISDGGAVTGWQAGSRAEMGQGLCQAGPAVEKAAHDDFLPF
jgi:hypothetical protein